MCMLFGLLAVITFESRKMPTVDWIIGKIVIILICTLCNTHMHYKYVSKNFVKQHLKALVFMPLTRPGVLLNLLFKSSCITLMHSQVK